MPQKSYKQELKQKYKINYQIIIGIFLIIFLIVLATLFLKMAKENAKCTGNPFVYGAKIMAEAGVEVKCFCTHSNQKYAGFNFDKDGLKENIRLGPLDFNP